MSNLSNKRALIKITQEDLHKMLTLPEDLYMVGVHADYIRNCILIHVIGESLEPVEAGVEAPTIEGQWNVLVWTTKDNQEVEPPDVQA